MTENRIAIVEVNRQRRGQWSGWMTLPPTNDWTRGVWWQLNVNSNPDQRILIEDPGAPPTIPPSTTEYRLARICPECCVSLGEAHDDWCRWASYDPATPATPPAVSVPS
jgi:hypothetical protein